MVGGCNHDKNQIPYPVGGRPTNWRNIIPKKFPDSCEGSELNIRLPSLGNLTEELGILRESDFEGQQNLITGFPQDWGKRDSTLGGHK